MNGLKRRQLRPVGFALAPVGIALWTWVFFGGPLFAGLVAIVILMVFITVWITRPPDH